MPVHSRLPRHAEISRFTIIAMNRIRLLPLIRIGFVLFCLLAVKLHAVTPAISAGNAYGLYVKPNGTLWATGSGSYGKLGNGSTANISTPVQVMAGVKAVHAANTHSFILKADGSAWGVGENAWGQLGDGTNTNRITPVFVLNDVQAFTSVGNHSMFLKTDGTVWATGANYVGQLGLGAEDELMVRPLVQVMTSVKAVAAGISYTLFLKTDGTVWATGSNDTGQFGNGTTTKRAVPIQVMSNVQEIETGTQSSFFLKNDGSVWAAGQNTYGQLGDGTTTNRSTPVQIFASGSGIQTMSSGADHTLFLKTDGTVLATGRNAHGELGDGTTTMRMTPVPVMSGVRAISAGYSMSLFLTNAGTNLAAGYNFYGQLGDGTTTNRSTPMAVLLPPPSSDASLSSLVLHTAALSPAFSPATYTYTSSVAAITPSILVAATKANVGALVSVNGVPIISGNESGSIVLSPGDNIITVSVMAEDGINTRSYTITLNRPGTPAAVLIPPANQTVKAGSSATFTITPFGTPPFTYQWQRNGRNLANSNSSSYTIATTSTADAGNYRCQVQNSAGSSWSSVATLTIIPHNPQLDAAAIAAGGSHTLILRTNGTVWAAGHNLYGQLGNGSTTNRRNPVMVMSGVKAIAAGNSHSLFLKNDGSVWAAGYNLYGQLGDGTSTNRSTPVQVMTGVKAISAGGFHSHFLKNDGSVLAAGYNLYGQIGDGSASNRPTPQGVMSTTNTSSGGGSHSLFVTSNGNLWSTGRNHEGQLGDGSTTNRLSPLQIITGNVASISAGGNHSLLVKTDFSAWATGSNSAGQIGNGGNVRLTTPAQVMTNVHEVSAGESHSIFVKTDGTAWATGSNEYGQLGTGGNADLNSPAQVMADVQTVSAGHGHTLLMKTDGSVWAFGDNSSGQLADRTTVDRTSPVLVMQLLQPTWQEAHFNADVANPVISGWNADPDHDGLQNLTERAFNLGPLQSATPILPASAGTSGLPRITYVNGRLQMEYIRMKPSITSDIIYTPQFSSTLGSGSWSDFIGTETVTSIDANWENVKLTDTASPAPATVLRFARVKLTLAD